jgi:hypothetical protein
VGEEAIDKAVVVRKNILLENSQAMVLAACWSTLEGIETFSLFPKNIKCGHYIFNKQGETSNPHCSWEGQ